MGWAYYRIGGVRSPDGWPIAITRPILSRLQFQKIGFFVFFGHVLDNFEFQFFKSRAHSQKLKFFQKFFPTCTQNVLGSTRDYLVLPKKFWWQSEQTKNFDDRSKEGQKVVLLKDGEFIWAVNHKVFKLQIKMESPKTASGGGGSLFFY